MKKAIVAAILALSVSPAWAAPTVQIRVPERFRLLEGQYFDLRVEAAGLTNTNATVSISVNGHNFTSSLAAPEVTTNNDADAASLDKAWTFRKVSFSTPGVWRLEATVNDSGASVKDSTRIGVQEFHLRGDKENIILFIGDAMGTAYRDAGRIVAKSVDNGFREGFFDELQEMDRMPVTGMVMTYAMNQLVSDSANAASEWSSGNKTVEGALNIFPDNTDFKAGTSQTAKLFALDNPRVETLWEYLKRVHGYRTGIVTTSDVTDATPAGEGSHTLLRGLAFDISKQFVDGAFVAGPQFDVIMGGGKERFNARTAANSGDTRNLVTELQGKGFTYVETRSALNSLPSSTGKVLGLFRTGNMNVAYDKLGLVRPSDEPAGSISAFPDQPFLDEMTDKAIDVLSRNDKPFILMVEGASIDKESHPNQAAGQIWDTIEFDKAVGVGRKFAKRDTDHHGFNFGRDKSNTLVLVTADHDQSMHIVGVADVRIPGAITNTKSFSPYPNTTPAPTAVGGSNPGEVGGFPDYADVNHDGYPENTNNLKIAVAYRTGNHTGSSIPITAEGPGALFFTGYFDQTDIFFKMARALSASTDLLDSALDLKKAQDILGPNY